MDLYKKFRYKSGLAWILISRLNSVHYMYVPLDFLKPNGGYCACLLSFKYF